MSTDFDMLRQLREFLPPVEPSKEIVELIGEQAANGGMVMYGLVERQTSNSFINTRKRVLLLLSYTSIFFCVPDTGYIKRIIKLGELGGKVTVNNAGFGSIVLRVPGEADALLHFTDSSKMGGLGTPDISTVDFFIRCLKQLFPLFHNNEQLEIEKIEKEPEQIKKDLGLKKPEGMPTTKEKVEQSKIRAEQLKKEQQEREEQRRVEEEARRVAEEKAAAEKEEKRRRKAEKERAEAEKLKAELDKIYADVKPPPEHVAETAGSPSPAGDSRATSAGKHHRPSPQAAEDPFQPAADFSDHDDEHDWYMNLDAKEHFDVLSREVVSAESIAEDLKAQLSKTEVAIRSLEESEKIMLKIIHDMRQEAHELHAENQTGLVGEAFKQQRDELAELKNAQTKAEEQEQHNLERCEAMRPQIQTVDYEIQQLLRKLEDERENYDDPIQKESPHRTQQTKRNINLQRKLYTLETMGRRRGEMSIQLSGLQEQLSGLQEERLLREADNGNAVEETLRAMNAAFERSTAKLKKQYTQNVKHKVDKALATGEMQAEAEASPERGTLEGVIAMLGGKAMSGRMGNATDYDTIMAQLEADEAALNEKLAKEHQRLVKINMRHEFLEGEHEAAKTLFETTVKEMEEGQDSLLSMTSQVAELKKKLEYHRAHREEVIRARVDAYEQGFADKLLAQEDRLEAARSGANALRATIAAAEKVVRKGPTIRRQIFHDL